MQNTIFIPSFWFRWYAAQTAYRFVLEAFWFEFKTLRVSKNSKRNYDMTFGFI